MKFNIALCDDDPQHLQYTEELVKRLMQEKGQSCEINTFRDPRRLLSAVESGDHAPRLAILDIEMPGMDGIALAEKLNGLLPACGIIFLTGYTDYVSDVYSAEHTFFVLKDKAEAYMGRALDKALEPMKQDEAYLHLHFRGSNVVLRQEQLLYIESARRKLSVHTLERSYEVNGRLDELAEKLRPEDFVRCHQSYLVNLHYVTGLEANQLLLTTGERIPVSRAHLNETRTRFLDHVRVKY